MGSGCRFSHNPVMKRAYGAAVLGGRSQGMSERNCIPRGAPVQIRILSVKIYKRNMDRCSRVIPTKRLAGIGDVVQLVRTLPCHGRGRGFESRRPRHSFQRVTGCDTGNSNPQSNPHLSAPLHHSHGRQEFTLRRPCLVAVFLRVQIERRLNLAVTQETLHGLGFDFRLVHQPVA